MPPSENVDQSICFLELICSKAGNNGRVRFLMGTFQPCSSQRSGYVAGIPVSVDIFTVSRTLWGWGDNFSEGGPFSDGNPASRLSWASKPPPLRRASNLLSLSLSFLVYETATIRHYRNVSGDLHSAPLISWSRVRGRLSVNVCPLFSSYQHLITVHLITLAGANSLNKCFHLRLKLIQRQGPATHPVRD